MNCLALCKNTTGLMTWARFTKEAALESVKIGRLRAEKIDLPYGE